MLKNNINNILLPYFMYLDEINKCVICTCINCESKHSKFYTVFNINEHLYDTNEIYLFYCPIKECSKIIPSNTFIITDHIKQAHPDIAFTMNLDTNNALYCNYCQNYINNLHYHCNMCEYENITIFFNIEKEYKDHFKESHNKMWLEHQCYLGNTCNNLETCNYNHQYYTNKYIVFGQELPDSICSLDKPWENKYCTLYKCNKDHFWGRMRLKCPIIEIIDIDDNIYFETFFDMSFNTLLKKTKINCNLCNNTKINRNLCNNTKIHRWHFQCYECSYNGIDVFFLEHDLDKHLALVHNKWILDYQCYYGESCVHCTTGECHYNHYNTNKSIISNDNVPENVCYFDRPWENQKCLRILCSKDHFKKSMFNLINKN
jgi:hypothetical protein